MSPFDSSPPEGAQPSQTFDTAGGIRVNVRATPEPSPAPAAPEQAPRVVITPPPLPIKERDAIVRRFYKEHGNYLRDLVLCQTGIAPESKKDVLQRVLIALWHHVDEHRGPPTHPRGFLHRVVQTKAHDHREGWRPKIQEGADADAQLSPALDPEGTAELAEERTKLERYLTFLTTREANVVRCRDLFDLTVEQTAQALNLKPGTVATIHARAKTKLEELGAASKRGTILGGGGRSGRARGTTT